MEKEILIKVHKSGTRDVVSVCDRDLIGKILSEGDLQIDLTGEFFKGPEYSLEEAFEEIKSHKAEDATFNIVGDNSVKISKELGIVDSEGISKISGVSFALVLL